MAQRVAIIDYGSGNLRSVAKALDRAARETGRAAAVSVTDDPRTILEADRLVLPGVGAFAACMGGLRERPGVLEALEHVVLIEKRPFLGVCVGMQLLAEQSSEYGSHSGLGWIPGKVTALSSTSPKTRTPHMGWNNIKLKTPHPLLAGLDDEAFYFAHSYRFEPENASHVACVTDHGGRLVAGVGRDNIFGAQFHPEKSQKAGLSFLSNFLAWAPL